MTTHLLEDDEAIAALLGRTHRVAVLGIKTEEQAGQPAFDVPQYLAGAGLEVIPVPVYYPDVTTILGKPVYRRLVDVPGEIDLVDVFRRAKDLEAHMEDILAKRPRAGVAPARHLEQGRGRAPGRGGDRRSTEPLSHGRSPPVGRESRPMSVPRPTLRIVAPIAAAKLVLHLLWANGYGYFRDELYYIACARHLAWGYVDHPPLSVAVLAGVRAALGDSRPALRLLPALVGAAVVLLAGWLAREIGGGRVAMVLAAIAALVAPVYLAIDHFYSMNALEGLFWTVAVCLVARILRMRGVVTWQTWAVLGVVLGLGLLNKASLLWLIGGVFLGLVLTPQRRLLRSPGPWLAVVIAAALLAPHVVWQIDNGWPTREFMQNATGEKMAAISPLAFLRAQIDDMHPLNALARGSPGWVRCSSGSVWPRSAPWGSPTSRSSCSWSSTRRAGRGICRPCIRCSSRRAGSFSRI